MQKSAFYLFVLFSLSATGRVQAQETAGSLAPSTIDRFQNGNMRASTAYYIEGMDGTKGELLGDHYLEPAWQRGNVQFYPHQVMMNGKVIKLDTIQNVPLRLDLKNNELEIKTRFGTKAVLGETVHYFSIERLPEMSMTTFVNVREFQGKARELSGFFEVLSDGELKLLQYTRFWVKKPTYVPALDTGSKDTQLMKEQHYYLARDKEAEKFSPGKSALLKWMQDQKGAMETFLKTRDFNYKNPRDLATIFDYYNSLK